MRMTRQTSRVAARGVLMFIIGVFGTHDTLAQVPQAPRSGSVVQAPAALPAGVAPAIDPGASTGAETVRLLVGRSTLVDVGSPIARVSLTSADVADALVTSSNQLLVHGKVPGAISMFVWNRGGSVTRYEIVVQRDLARLSEQMQMLFPGERIQVHSNGKQVVLAGTVSRKEVAEKAASVAAGYVDKKEDVVTLLAAQPGPPANQVLLRVRFAEVSRSAMTEFGMSIFTSATGINHNIGRATTQQFPAPRYEDLAWTKADGSWGSDVTSAEGKLNFSDFLNLFLLNQKYDLGVLIKALQNRGLFESLAEPNLVAESGKEASFLAGGEFPIPVVQGSQNNSAVTVEFKEFGVRLNFTPTVNGDRVHLKVKPEVSTLDYGNAVVLNGFRIPAISTRRTETELELRDGQTFAIAGLMNNQMQSTLQKIPGIGDIPILGHLFRSKAAQKNQTELVVMITPEILRQDSPGVTRDVPRLQEPFLPPMPENRTQPMPPPAFAPQSRSQAGDVKAPAVTAERAISDRAREQAGPAGDSQVGAVGAPAVTPVAPAQPSAAEEAAAKRAQEAWETAARQQAVPVVEVTPEVPNGDAAQLTDIDARTQAAERQRLEEAARKQAARDAKAAEKARKEEARREAAAKKEAEKLAKEQAKRDARAAKEQAKRDAAAAKKQAKQLAEAQRSQPVADKQAEEAAAGQTLEAKREAEREAERQRAIDAAADRLRAAEAEYQAELARRTER